MSAFLCMSEAEIIIKSLAEHRRETHADLSGLRNAISEMAAAVARLTTTVARVEERHARQDDGIKRLGAHVDDHEVRIRTMERANSRWSGQIGGGWKVFTVIGAWIMGSIGVISLAVKLWP